MSKNKEYAFCIDSDGCAMDTMTYKHQLFFGPLAAKVFKVPNQEDFLKKWDYINLFSRTRGVNRFVGLVMGLEYADIGGIDKLKQWVDSTPSLSNASLEKELKQNPSDDLEKALKWSKEVNQHIKEYQGDALAFAGVQEGLAILHELGKVYVVSSANREAVEEEWSDQALIGYVDNLYCQNFGKKEDVIAALVAEGYKRDHLLMVGDSPGDLAAAEQNQVAFYPILVGKETESWKNLKDSFSQKFISGHVSTEELEQLKQSFWENLE